jgi:hypothetical protein
LGQAAGACSSPSCALSEPVEDAAVEVEEAAVRSCEDRGREDRTRPRAGVDAHEDEPGDVAQVMPLGLDRLALITPPWKPHGSTVTPANPKQAGNLVAGEPLCSGLPLLRQLDFDVAPMEVALGVMVDGRPQVLKITPGAPALASRRVGATGGRGDL